MKEPYLADQAFIDDLAEVRGRDRALDLWWLGQSGFLLHFQERWALVDPYLSDSLTRKYAATDKPHVRMSRRVVDPAALMRQLGGLSCIACTHAHTDHMDAETLRALVGQSRSFEGIVVPKAEIQLAYERVGSDPLNRPVGFAGLDDGESSGVGVKVTAVASAHETIERDSAGHCKHLGYVFEFSLSFVSSSGSKWQLPVEWTVYHSGDTVLYEGLVEKLSAFKIDVAILPINGRAPERRAAGNLWGREAAWLAKEIGAKLVVPCHYDMFEFNTATPDEFVAECEKLGQPYKVLRLGERLTLPKEQEG